MKNKSVLYHPTAYHEAGHVVMAYLLGIRIKRASIISGKDYVGIVHHEKIVRGEYAENDNSLRNRNRMEKSVLISLAGDIAQKHHAPRSLGGASDDHDKASDLALMVNSSSESANASLNWLTIRATDVLKLRWPMVDAVARELVKQKELGREQIQALLWRAMWK